MQRRFDTNLCRTSDLLLPKLILDEVDMLSAVDIESGEQAA